MTVLSRNSKRSDFFRSINIVWPCNKVRTAQTDFWGAVGLVCAIGLVAKIAQAFFTN